MPYTLEGYFEFTPDDLPYNRKGQLSNRQYDEMQAELKNYRRSILRIIAFACGSVALFSLLLIANSGIYALQVFAISTGMTSVAGFGVAWWYYTRLYRPFSRDLQNGKIGILKSIRPSKFVAFDFTESDVEDHVLMHKYETSEVKLVIEDEVFALLDPDTPYHFYYWTANTQYPEYGNTIISLEPAT